VKPPDSRGTGKAVGDPASLSPGGATGVGGAGSGTPEDELATGGCGGATAGDPSRGGGSGGAGGDVFWRLSTWRCTACPALSAAFFKSSRKPISMPLVVTSCFAQHMRWRQPMGQPVSRHKGGSRRSLDCAVAEPAGGCAAWMTAPTAARESSRLRLLIQRTRSGVIRSPWAGRQAPSGASAERFQTFPRGPAGRIPCAIPPR
jgi:hypothetical protein